MSGRRTRLWLAGASMIAAVTVLATSSGDRARAGDTHAQQDKLARAEALAAAPAADRGPLAARYSADDARDAAGARGQSVPLPDGGNFNGVQWEQAGGAIAEAELRSVLEYNAACQWLRAWREGREVAVAHRVLEYIPAWPALRDTPTAGLLREAAADSTGTGPVVLALLESCHASHQREVQYAARLGLPPSS